MLDGLSAIQTLTPKPTVNLPKNTYSGNFGTDVFPMHTDMAHWHQPPRYFVLRCLVPDSKITTNIISFEKALTGLPKSIISRSMFKPRRKLDGKLFLLRFAESKLFRWDQLYLVPENKEAQLLSRHLLNLRPEETTNLILNTKGHTILIDNWKVLHGRSNTKDINSPRVIQRTYLSELKT